MRNAAEFVTSQDDIFGRIARRYDVLCDIFSLGIHRIWKRRVAELIAAEPWSCLLDAASGTGDIVARVLAKQINTTSCRVIASDISPAMLEIAKDRLSGSTLKPDIRVLDAEAMPDIASGSIDLYSISLGLKITDRTAVLAEAFRVLKPGGRIVILEASAIPLKWLQQLYLVYMGVCMPIIGWLATGGDASAYQYLLKGIRQFPGAEDLAGEIEAAGFIGVNFERLSLGIVAIHVARKSEVAGGDGQALHA